MNYEEVIKLPPKVKISKFKENNLRLELIEKTNFLPISAGIGERVYCVDYNIKSTILCYCGNPVKYLKYSEGYAENCSRKCAYSNPKVSEKRKKTCLEKYGVTSFTQTDSYLIKTKETNLKRYGKEFYLQTEDYKTKSKETSLEKYGTDHHMMSTSFKENFKSKMIDKFGVDNVSKLEDVKNKKSKTFQKNFGMNHIFCSNDLKSEYMTKKYGVKHNTELDWVLEKMKNTGVNNGNYTPDELKNEFQKYRSSVNKITDKNKDELLNYWNGQDYYDDEFIKNNFKLNYNHKDYPTIDHKISIQYGFLNKIDPSVIGSLENLCITKRSINISKNKLTEQQFIKKLN
jgi:hypothetical protein